MPVHSPFGPLCLALRGFFLACISFMPYERQMMFCTARASVKRLLDNACHLRRTELMALPSEDLGGSYRYVFGGGRLYYHFRIPTGMSAQDFVTHRLESIADNVKRSYFLNM